LLNFARQLATLIGKMVAASCHFNPEDEVMRIFLFFLFFKFAGAGVYYVAPSGNDFGPGSQKKPFKTIGRALKVAHSPADKIYLQTGIYREQLKSYASGKKNRPIQLIGRGHVEVRFAGQPLKIRHNFLTIRNILFNGLWANKSVARIGGNDIILQNCEFKNSKRDLVTLGNVHNITIDSCRIHHGFSWYPQTRREPHGISTRGVKNLSISHCTIYQITGDCIQISPTRDDWDAVSIENCTFYVAPISRLEAEQAGLPDEAVGKILAENAIDLKARKKDDPAKHHITIRNSSAHGFRSTRISNAAAFNIKNPVTCLLDGITAYDNEIAFRLRKPAMVTVQNCLMYQNDVAIRAEDLRDNLIVLNSTFGLNNKKQLKWIGTMPRRLEMLNNLFVSQRLPGLLAKDLVLRAGNRAVAQREIGRYFVDAGGGDYHLKAGSPAIDSGKEVKRFHIIKDRDNKKRPQGAGYDLGAFEYSGK